MDYYNIFYEILLLKLKDFVINGRIFTKIEFFCVI